MASPAPSERSFEPLHRAVHKRLPFSTVKVSHTASTVFHGSVYRRMDQRRVLCELKADWEKFCPEASDTSGGVDASGKGQKSMKVYLALSGVRSQNNSDWRRLVRMVHSVSIQVPDTVEEISGESFSGCKCLSRVTFGASSSLMLIGRSVFSQSGLREIRIPDSVEELCEDCFSGCKNLISVTFGESSSLKVIGNGVFHESGLREIHIPDSVGELCEKCFSFCKSLSRVTFGESSSLKLIGKGTFRGSGLVEIRIPDSVEELCEECFYGCKNLSRVTFGASSSLRLIGNMAFQKSGLSCFCLPGSVESIGGSSFSECPMKEFAICDTNQLFDVLDGLLVSKDKRVCYGYIGEQLEALILPDRVEELSEACFCGCERFSRVTFRESSSLKLMGKWAFRGTWLQQIHIPDSVEEIGEECFCECQCLGEITFGKFSSLKSAGSRAFCDAGLMDVCCPRGIEDLVRDASPHYVRFANP